MPQRNRVLLVDDEPLLLMELEDALSDLGWRVIGAASRLETALVAARELDYDFALLDVNLGGERIDPVAELVAAKGARSVFLTGYDNGFPGAGDSPVLEKPVTAQQLHAALLSFGDVDA